MDKQDELYNRMMFLMAKKRAYSFLTYAPDFMDLKEELRSEVEASNDMEFKIKGGEILWEIDTSIPFDRNTVSHAA